ncbi:hypothetical protein JB92DRAFT_3139600 [Gautieria morchelliformis]|nr:hypothetical protein JB92DRAFT_3139600 [Gautieria morchelliformis]
MLVSVTYQTGIDSKRRQDLLPVTISQDVMDSPTKSPSTPTTCNARGPGHSIDVDSIHNKLMDLGYYLGFPDLPVKVGNTNGRLGDQLVKKDTSMNAPEEAVLSVVGQIALDDFWLLPLGGWMPGNEKFVDSPDGCEGGSEVNDDDQDPFSFATWPVTDAAREAMNSVKHTHDISPLPAFDINGDPIIPSQYDIFLKGAIVKVHFTLTSWVFAGRSVKAMSIPVIREMLVISPPKPLVASPMKRKNIRDGHSTSPKKKIHA